MNNFIILITKEGGTEMHPNIHKKMRRFLTEPDQCRMSNEKQFKKLAIKEFKLNITKRQNLNEIYIPNFKEKQGGEATKKQAILPNTIKRNKQRHALFKLPGLNNQNQEKIDQNQQKNTVFKRSNPLYVVNSLFQIMKQDICQQNPTLCHSRSNHNPRKDSQKLTQTIDANKNEFSQFQMNSIRVSRGPRLLNNQINRLTQQSILSRRKIYSQEKSRMRYEDGELVTFYNCKQKAINQNKEGGSHNDYLGYS